MIHPSEELNAIERAGVIFDLDGTLADSSWREIDDSVDPSFILDDPVIEPCYSLAREWELQSTQVPTAQIDVLYLTGRSHLMWTPTKLWLSKNKLFGTLICRPTTVDLWDISRWKADTIAQLMKKHHWQHVTLYEDNPKTLQLTQSKIPQFAFSPALVIADGEKVDPSAKITGLAETDILNFKLLMGRLAEDNSWKKLLLRRWKSRSDLLDAALDFIAGKENRREFRQMIERLWKAS
jgi:hydroxymethylpyrimidine pyrophosphatase-like HAD family hydrolase